MVCIFGRNYKIGINDVHMKKGSAGDCQNIVGADSVFTSHFLH